VLDKLDPNYDSDGEGYYLEEYDLSPPAEMTLEDLDLLKSKEDAPSVESMKSL